jgi:hypothetical protein
MQQRLNLQAYTSGNRNKIIDEIKGAISGSDGYILNFNMFSDYAISLSIEIEEGGIQDLHKTLSQILKVSELDPENINTDSRKDWLILMNITFSGGKGEIKSKIPSVPG